MIKKNAGYKRGASFQETLQRAMQEKEKLCLFLLVI